MIGPMLENRSRWRPSLAQRFMLGSLVVLLAGMVGVGAWVARQIEDGVVQRAAATTALYVDSLVTPPLQDLASGPTLSPESQGRLEWLFADTPLGREVVLFNVWYPDGHIVFSTVPDLAGQQLSVDPSFEAALTGRVAADIGDPEGADEIPSAAPLGSLLEIYSPVRGRGTNEVIGVAEFYYAADDLREEVAVAQRRSWLVLGGATLLIYAILAAFVQRASDTIDRQQRALSDQVSTLTRLLAQNEELHQRARGAAARTVALNERFLRRISSDLHDGPAQDVSLALLRLDNVAAHHGGDGYSRATRDEGIDEEIGLIQHSLRRALQELRSTSGGILLPQLGALSVAGAVEHVVRGHRRKNGATADVVMHDLPEQAPLATKIALYRIIQEALSNAGRHAAGARVTVDVSGIDGHLRIEVADDGPGFDPTTENGREERLGLVGMRERVESLGGTLEIDSAIGHGTRVVANLPLASGDTHG
jgi:signal transduction histidine kinase